MRTFKIYSLSNFQVCNTVLTIVTILYIRSFRPYSSLQLKVVPFTKLCLFLPPSITFLLSASVSSFFFTFCIQVRAFSISVSAFFHLSYCPQVPSMLSQMAAFPSFSWLDNSPLFIYTTSSLTHLLMGT